MNTAVIIPEKAPKKVPKKEPENPHGNSSAVGFSNGNIQANAAQGGDPEVLTHIYEKPINIVVYQRSLEEGVARYGQLLMQNYPQFNLRSVIKPEKALRSLSSLLPELADQSAFVTDLALLLDMYACLFDLEEVGVRLQVLDRAMCPRFHTDKLGCRLVSTYQGIATEWLYNHDVDRSKLGAGSQGLCDAESGVYKTAESINSVAAGDVVLLKGDGWFDNQGQGIVHRSPAVVAGTQRLVVTLDFA